MVNQSTCYLVQTLLIELLKPQKQVKDTPQSIIYIFFIALQSSL